MLRTALLNTLLLPSLASAVALPSLKREDGGVSINGVNINFFGCDDINSKTGNHMFKDIVNAWDDAIKLADAIPGVDTNTDIGFFDYFGPNIQTEGMGYKILSVYKRLLDVTSSGDGASTPSVRLRTRNSGEAAKGNPRLSDGSCKYIDDENWINHHPDKSYINIRFYDLFFSAATLDEVIDKGKGASMKEKYNTFTTTILLRATR